MCSSGIVSVLALTLQIIGALALLVGFFVGLTSRDYTRGGGVGIFLGGAIVFVIGSRLSGVC